MEKDDDDIQPIEVENGYWRKIEKIIIHRRSMASLTLQGHAEGRGERRNVVKMPWRTVARTLLTSAPHRRA
jgi:hypothetical protein